MGCKGTQKKKTRMNDLGDIDQQINNNQSTRMRRHDIEIESSGNLQVSGKQDTYYLKNQRGFKKILMFLVEQNDCFFVVTKATRIIKSHGIC